LMYQPDYTKYYEDPYEYPYYITPSRQASIDYYAKPISKIVSHAQLPAYLATLATPIAYATYKYNIDQQKKAIRKYQLSKLGVIQQPPELPPSQTILSLPPSQTILSLPQNKPDDNKKVKRFIDIPLPNEPFIMADLLTNKTETSSESSNILQTTQGNPFFNTDVFIQSNLTISPEERDAYETAINESEKEQVQRFITNNPISKIGEIDAKFKAKQEENIKRIEQEREQSKQTLADLKAYQDVIYYGKDYNLSEMDSIKRGHKIEKKNGRRK